jgi:hypothetical protein
MGTCTTDYPCESNPTTGNPHPTTSIPGVPPSATGDPSTQTGTETGNPHTGPCTGDPHGQNNFDFAPGGGLSDTGACHGTQ